MSWVSVGTSACASSRAWWQGKGDERVRRLRTSKGGVWARRRAGCHEGALGMRPGTAALPAMPRADTRVTKLGITPNAVRRRISAWSPAFRRRGVRRHPSRGDFMRGPTQPGGLPACSRWLSEATPPDTVPTPHDPAPRRGARSRETTASCTHAHDLARHTGRDVVKGPWGCGRGRPRSRRCPVRTRGSPSLGSPRTRSAGGSAHGVPPSGGVAFAGTRRVGTSCAGRRNPEGCQRVAGG